MEKTAQCYVIITLDLHVLQGYPTLATCGDINGPDGAGAPLYYCGNGWRLRLAPENIIIAGLNNSQAKPLCCQLVC